VELVELEHQMQLQEQLHLTLVVEVEQVIVVYLVDLVEQVVVGRFSRWFRYRDRKSTFRIYFCSSPLYKFNINVASTRRWL
jgi:hypothetical protein